MPAKMSLSDLPPELRKQLRIRQSKFSKESVRQHALRVLASVASLTQVQRTRVLQHALRVNQI